jgi:hypothetical protein
MRYLSIFAVIILSFFSFKNVKAQSPDTLADVYRHYMQLNKQVSRVDSVSMMLQTQYTNFDAILRSNNDALKRITNAQLFSYDRSLKQQRGKIINTVDFIRSANTSLNALQVVGSVSSYLDNISQLNNPANNELGFALTDDVVKILETRILAKKGLKTNPTKFTRIVKEVMNAPLTSSFARTLPVVSNIKNVVDLVITLTATEKNVEVEDLVQMKNDLRKYVEHCEGLEQANYAFTSNLNTLNVRIDALKLIMKNYATERLRPFNTTANLDTFRNLTSLVNHYGDKEDAQMKIDRILEECKNPNGSINYEKALSDKRLFYPEYAVNQAQVIQDEVMSVSKAYLSNLYTYQRNIEVVLNNSKNNKLGDAKKIEQKMVALQKLLDSVSDAVKNSVNIEDLQVRLQRINGFLYP